MKKIRKSVLPLIMLFLNTTNLFADIGSRGKWDNNGDSYFSVILMAITAVGVGGFFGYAIIAEKGFKDKESNKIGCRFIIVAIIGLIFLVAMCSH